jgi:Domain of unknown function (DUF4926)
MHETVELTHDIGDWPAGTAGVVVDESAHGGALLVELVGPDGKTLDLLDVQSEDVRPIEPPVHYATPA